MDDLSVLEAVRGDIAELTRLDERLGRSGLAASALALAREMDDPANSATSKSMCAGRLLETLDRLRALAPEKPLQDGLDDLTARRTARRAGGAAA